MIASSFKHMWKKSKQMAHCILSDSCPCGAAPDGQAIVSKNQGLPYPPSTTPRVCIPVPITLMQTHEAFFRFRHTKPKSKVLLRCINLNPLLGSVTGKQIHGCHLAEIFSVDHQYTHSRSFLDNVAKNNRQDKRMSTQRKQISTLSIHSNNTLSAKKDLTGITSWSIIVVLDRAHHDVNNSLCGIPKDDK